MCSCLCHYLNETPLGLSFPGPLGPTASPWLEFSSNAEAASNPYKHNRLHREGWVLGGLVLCHPRVLLSQPHTRISALSSPPRRCCYSVFCSWFLSDFVLPLSNPPPSNCELPKSKRSKVCRQKQTHNHQTPELGGWSGSWGSHSGRWALGKKESGIQLLTCQKSIWEDPTEQEYEQLRTRDLPRFGGLNQVLASLVTQLTK